MGRKGRKVELTRQLVDHHARCRAEGVPIAEACAMAGHGVSVYYRWCREAEEWPLLQRMNELGLFDEDPGGPGGFEHWKKTGEVREEGGT